MKRILHELASDWASLFLGLEEHEKPTTKEVATVWVLTVGGALAFWAFS
ncbi:hypothetical protein [Rufibacter soli]